MLIIIMSNLQRIQNASRGKTCQLHEKRNHSKSQEEMKLKDDKEQRIFYLLTFHYVSVNISICQIAFSL